MNVAKVMNSLVEQIRLLPDTPPGMLEIGEVCPPSGRRSTHGLSSSWGTPAGSRTAEGASGTDRPPASVTGIHNASCRPIFHSS